MIDDDNIWDDELSEFENELQVETAELFEPVILVIERPDTVTWVAVAT